MIQAPETQKIISLVALAANFGKELPEPLLDLWLDLLGAYSPGEVQAAVRAVIEQYAYKTLPPFAVLKEALENARGTSKESLDLQALAEWGVLMGSLALHGRYRRPRLHDTTEHVLHLMGGWSMACSWESAALDFKRRDFCRHWADAHGRVASLRLGAAGVATALRERGEALSLEALGRELSVPGNGTVGHGAIKGVCDE